MTYARSRIGGSKGLPAAVRAEATHCDSCGLAARTHERVCLLALDAAAKARKYVDFELVIAGGGPHAHEVEEWIRARDLSETARYLGSLPFSEMPDLYASGDILLFTSLRDSLGTQLLEAAAAGLPVIAFDLHGVRTHVPSSASIKVPIELGIDGIADAIVDLSQDDARRKQMSDAALAFAHKHTWAANAEAMEMIYVEAQRAHAGVCAKPRLAGE